MNKFENLKLNIKSKIIFKIIIVFILFGINLYLVFAQSIVYTAFNSNNKGFILRFPTKWGNYNLEISATTVYNNLIPQLKIYATNTSNNLNKHRFLIRSFYGRSLIYSHNVDSNKSIIIDLNPPASGNSNGSINFYHYAGYYRYYAKIYGNIENLIDIYTCEDNEWMNSGGTCLGNFGNPRYCFGNSPGFGKIIHDGLLTGVGTDVESGLTICVRTNY